MVVKFWAGYISTGIIMQHSNIDAWAVQWLHKAEKAEAKGNELIVFEVPKKELSFILAGIDQSLQTEFDNTGLAGYK